MSNWKDKAFHMVYDDNMHYSEIGKILFPEMESVRAGWKVRDYIRTTERYKAEHSNGKTVETKEKPPKVEIVQNFEPSIARVDWNGNRIIRFGLMGDTQINSKYTQLTYLHKYYDECARREIENVYHAGDMDDGDQMRMGHQYECYNQGADDHVDEIVRVYPERKGTTTHFIIGNHDASITKRSGHDIGKAIAEKRSDMKYLGADCAIIYLTPNCTLELRHPWDGTAYAISYKIQKMVEAMSGGEKPNILAVGHYHKQQYYISQHSLLPDRMFSGTNTVHAR
jgi:hypothetical protein